MISVGITRTLALCLSLFLSFAGVALAQSQAQVSEASRIPLRLALDPCAAPLRYELRNILQVELQSPVLELEAAPAAPPDPNSPTASAPAVDAHIGCREGVFVIDLFDPDVRHPAHREMDLSAVAPAGRARTLALGIVELIAAVRASVHPASPEPSADATGAAPPAIEVAPPPVLNPAPSRQAAHWPVARVEMALSADATQMGAPALRLFGGGLGVTYRVRRWLILAAQLRYEYANTEITHGEARVESLSSSLSYGLRVYEADTNWLDLSIGGRVGTARISATPDDPGRFQSSEVRGLFGGPLLSTRFELRPFRRFTLGIGAEAGLVLLPVVGWVEGRREVAFDGGWMSVAVSLGIIF